MPSYKRKAGAYTVDGIPGKARRVTTMIVAPRPGRQYGMASRIRRRLNRRTGGFMGIEKKFYDTSLVQSTLLSSIIAGEHNPTADISLNTVTQGDGESQRDGRQISMDSITLKGAIELPTEANRTTMNLSGYTYVAIVLDKQTNGALLNSEDVFINPGSANSLIANPFRNLQFIQRFQVLAWKRIRHPAQATQFDATNIEQGGRHLPFQLFAKLKGMKVNYTNTTEVIANITDNGLNVVAFTSSTTQAPVLTYKARLRFYG